MKRVYQKSKQCSEKCRMNKKRSIGLFSGLLGIAAIGIGLYAYSRKCCVDAKNDFATDEKSVKQTGERAIDAIQADQMDSVVDVKTHVVSEVSERHQAASEAIRDSVKKIMEEPSADKQESKNKEKLDSIFEDLKDM